jgi:hypothetical protein
MLSKPPSIPPSILPSMFGPQMPEEGSEAEKKVALEDRRVQEEQIL